MLSHSGSGEIDMTGQAAQAEGPHKGSPLFFYLVIRADESLTVNQPDDIIFSL